MNDDTRSMQNGDDFDVDMIIDRLCREFNDKWNRDHNFAVHDMLDRVKEELPEEEDQYECIKELIFVEIDLRFAHAVSIDRGDYYQLYPDFREVIDAAIQAAKENHDNYHANVDPVVAIEISDELEDSGLSAPVLDDEGNSRIPNKIGPYKDLEFIANGGFGVVYRAYDSNNSRTVALKFPRKRRLSTQRHLDQFRNEAEKAQLLNHGGIVKTFALEEIEGFLFIVQEFIEGEDLKSSIERELPEHVETASLVAKVADALDHAHRQSIYHRDIKPANILIDQDGVPKIADFGLAISDRELYEQIGQIHGTLPYMSPEVIKGHANFIDGRSDIWSLGVTLYEMISGNRPFRGSTDTIKGEICSNDPRPLVQGPVVVDRELDRICLQCLERSQSDRFKSAGILSEALNDWVQAQQKPDVTTEPDIDPVFVPRGLHSYKEEDHDFFLELLPGPRDGKKRPRSIRDCCDRIVEPVSDENRTPFGVICGPSGCGKSSFVKAGLLPIIKDDVDLIYVECTRDDTGPRLLGKLRKVYDDIDKIVEERNEDDIPELFRGLQLNAFPNKRKKALVVLDQFEQWLTADSNYELNQLGEALKHCDGKNLQCLVIVRNEFMSHLNRLMAMLQIDLQNGKNMQTIELFDETHAKNVLRMIGKAYGKEKIDEQFVNRSIAELSKDGDVICVQLTLYAEMVRKLPAWTVKEFSNIEGGVGKRFLRQTFGPNGEGACRDAIEDAQKILGCLLPESGMDIRGSMKRQSDIIEQCDIPEHRTKALIKEMASDNLRLITLTDPDQASADDVHIQPDEQDPYYQLTHDFLVPANRDWINEEREKTRTGRAEIRLEQLAAGVRDPDCRPDNLPTNLEWLSWQYLLRKHDYTDKERTIMRFGRGQFLKSFSAISAILLVVIAPLVVLNNERIRRTEANQLVKQLRGLDHGELHKTIHSLPDYADLVEDEVEKLFESDESKMSRRGALGLLSLRENDRDLSLEVANNIIASRMDPKELKISVEVLERYGSGYETPLIEQLNNGEVNTERFRAVNALVILGIEENWQLHAGMIAEALISEPITTQAQWVEMLSPIGDSLLPTFEDIFLRSTSPSATNALALCLFSFKGVDERSEEMAYLILDSNESQFDSIHWVFEQHHESFELASAVSSMNVNSSNRFRAEQAISLLRLKDQQKYIEVLADRNNPITRSFAIILATSARVDFDDLRKLYDHIVSIQNPYLTQAILMVYAQRVLTLYDAQHLSWLDARVRKHCLDDEDSGCFSAAELVVRRRGKYDVKKYRQERRESGDGSGVMGSVFINSQYQAFAIIGTDAVGSRLCISMSEVSNDEIYALLENDPPSQSSDIAHTITDMQVVYDYCNRLSEADGLQSDQWIFPDDLGDQDQQSFDPTKHGYRPITTEEWRSISATNPKEWYWTDIEIAKCHAWIYENSGGQMQKVARLLPNDLGFFDLFGNAYEVTISSFNPGIDYQVIGYMARQNMNMLGRTETYTFRPLRPQYDMLPGLRIARLLED